MKTLGLIIFLSISIFASERINQEKNTEYIFYRLNLQIDKDSLKECEDDYSIGKVSESCRNSYKLKKYKEFENKFKLQADLLTESIK